jgi:hypothetical protein
VASVNTRLSIVALSATLAASRLARADVPPPPNYVETCTLAQQCPDGGTTCSGHDESSVECAKSAAAQGKEERCRSWGASSGVTVYCPPGSKPPPPSTATTAQPKAGEPKVSDPKVGKGGCASCAIQPSSRAAVDRAGVAVVLALAGAVALRARTRRSR